MSRHVASAPADAKMSAVTVDTAVSLSTLVHIPFGTPICVAVGERSVPCAARMWAGLKEERASSSDWKAMRNVLGRRKARSMEVMFWCGGLTWDLRGGLSPGFPEVALNLQFLKRDLIENQR